MCCSTVPVYSSDFFSEAHVVPRRDSVVLRLGAPRLERRPHGRFTLEVAGYRGVGGYSYLACTRGGSRDRGVEPGQEYDH